MPSMLTSAAPREATLNDKFYDRVKELRELCYQLDALTNRIAPKPPTPQTPGRLGETKIEGGGTPCMTEVLTQFCDGIDTLRGLANELSRIA